MTSPRLDLSAKFVAPGPAGLLRSRLLDVASRRVGVVLAPAGHGKTTLLGQVAAQFDGAVAWYRIDVGDRRPAALAAGIARTLRPLGISAATESLDDVAAALDAAHLERPVLLVLDDFHEIAGSESEQSLVRFISVTPATVHVLLGARRVAGIDLLNLRMSGSVQVIDEEDLRFRSWEVERLFRDFYGEPLLPEDAAALTRRTEGWAAGLAMFHLLTEGRSPASRRRALGDLSRGSRLVRSYLVREVLGDLPADLRDFMRRTSALGVLTSALCDALLGTTGSQEVLEELEQRRLFTSAEDDGERFRYHQVLLDHLELELTEHLGPEGSRAWYARAGSLLLDVGEVRAAFRAFARAEDWGAVEQLLHRHGAEVVAMPLGAVESLLPAELCSQDPWLLLASARRLAARGALADAVSAFRLAESVAEDAQLAAICRDEARSTAVWLPGGDPVARGWAGVVRAATQRNPRLTLPVALALPGAEGRLAAAIVALLTGDFHQAGDLVRQAADHPDAGPRAVAMAACAGHALRLLAGRPPGVARDDEGLALDTLMLGTDVGGWPWLARIGRSLLDAATGEEQSLARLVTEADRDADPWGGALVRLVQGVATRDVRLLSDAALRLAALDAAVAAQWARWLAMFAAPALDSREIADAVQSARSLGLRDAVSVVQAWGLEGRRAASTNGVRAPSQVAGGTAAPRLIELRLLGGFEIAVDGARVDLAAVRPRARSTLRMLATHAGEGVHRDVLAERLWPDAEPEAALRSLQVAVSSLRTLLDRDAGRGHEVIERVGETYRLAMPEGSRSDLRDFETQLRAARRCRRAGDDYGERVALESALGDYRGDVLPEEGAAEWVVGERERLRLAASTAAERLACCLVDAGDVASAIESARRALQLDPYRDSAWRLLVRLQQAVGDHAAAQATRLQHRRVLQELGVPVPSEPTA